MTIFSDKWQEWTENSTMISHRKGIETDCFWMFLQIRTARWSSGWAVVYRDGRIRILVRRRVRRYDGFFLCSTYAAADFRDVF